MTRGPDGDGQYGRRTEDGEHRGVSRASSDDRIVLGIYDLN